MARYISANTRRRLINLTYRVFAKDFPHCTIERDPLHRRYPDVNYGVRVFLPSYEEYTGAKRIIEHAFQRRGYTTETEIRERYDGTSMLEVYGFYYQD